MRRRTPRKQLHSMGRPRGLRLKTQLMIGVSAELDHENRRRAFRSRVEGDIALYEKTLDRDLLKSAEDGVASFKWIRRPFYVNRA